MLLKVAFVASRASYQFTRYNNVTRLLNRIISTRMERMAT